MCVQTIQLLDPSDLQGGALWGSSVPSRLKWISFSKTFIKPDLEGSDRAHVNLVQSSGRGRNFYNQMLTLAVGYNLLGLRIGGLYILGRAGE